MSELANLRYERLCQEYLLDLNQTQAAIRAGYSPKSANQQASELFAKPNIRARVAALMAERSARTGVNADRVLRELARIGFARLTDVADADSGGLRADASGDDLAAVASVKVKRGDDFTEREIKLCDKNKALELLGKHLGMFTERVAISDERPVIVDDLGGGAGGG